METLRNEIGGLEKLDENTLRAFILGVLIHLKHQGAVWYPVLDMYVEDWGNTFRINRIPWMPNFGMNARTPSFLTTKNTNRFDRLSSGHSKRMTWYEGWADKCFAPVFPLVAELIRPIYELIFKALTDFNILEERQIKSERVWGILPTALRIGKDVLQFSCKRCGHDVSVSLFEKDD